MQNIISNSCLPVDILDQIHNLIDIGYSSYSELDRDQKIEVLEAFLDNKGIDIYDLQCDLDIQILNDNQSLNDIIDQIFEPINDAYKEQINDLFISAAMDRQHPAQQWEG